jgi:hypothetical protein
MTDTDRRPAPSECDYVRFTDDDLIRYSRYEPFIIDGIYSDRNGCSPRAIIELCYDRPESGGNNGAYRHIPGPPVDENAWLTDRRVLTVTGDSLPGDCTYYEPHIEQETL